MTLLEAYNLMISPAWLCELFLLAISWVLICRNIRKPIDFLAHLAAMFVILGFSNLLLMMVVTRSNNSFAMLWGYVHGIVSLIYVFVCAPFRTRTRILVWLIMYNVVLCASALSGQCSFYADRIFGDGTGSILRVAIRCLMPAAALLVRKYDFDNYPSIPNSGLTLATVLVLCVQTVAFIESKFFNAGESVVLILVVVYACMLITSVVVINTFYTMCCEQQNINELHLERQRLLSEREITHLAESVLDDLRCIRHDLKNQYAYMQILLESERYDEMKDYFENLQNNLPPQLNLIDCGNRTVNTVLNSEIKKIRPNGVSFDTQLVVPPVLPFKDTDVCSIISNLVDNAFEECMRLKELGRTDLNIRMEIHPHQSYLLIRCLNSTDRENISRSGMGLRTTKKESRMHGYGTRIVSRLAEKYNGCAEYSLDEGMFVAQVMLDMTGGK